jgi:hypothetical protein
VAGVARPPCTKEESGGGCGEDPARGDLLGLGVSLRHEACFDAAALRRRVLHGGDLLGVVTSTPSCLCSALDLFVGSVSSFVCWWECAVVVSFSLQLWCIVARSIVVRPC